MTTAIRAAPFIAIALLFAVLAPARGDHYYVGHYTYAFPGPQAYRDPSVPVVYYVESDGRHVSAIGLDGKVLWNRDPFEDAGVKPYRVPKPLIVFIGKPPQPSHVSTK